jgi:tetratricopeptide (TPR) repeat protein
LVLGISVHIFLYIRSGLNPAIDEVDPETWKSLYAHLRREQYPPINVFNRKAGFLFQLQHFGGYFREQFRMFGDVMVGSFNLGKAAVAIPTALGLFGIVANFNRERRTWVLNFVSLFLNSLGLILFLNFSDHEVRERDYFYGGAFYFFSIFIGIGAGAFLMMLVDGVRKGGKGFSGWVVPVGVVLLVCSVLPARYHWYRHDRSKNYIARDYAYNMLAGLEPDAIIFTNGDNDTFPLWYIRNVEDFRNDVRVANLSLLNTDWYIKQLRDNEPKVPISLSDEEIELLRPVALKGGGVAWKRDLAVQHIIQETNWKRPIYIAVTVPHEVWKPYASYLEMQGMVRRLVPYRGKYLTNDFMLARNFDEIFKFRGVLTEDGEIDDSVYKTIDTRGMFVNFAVAAFQLAQDRARAGDFEDAVSRMEMSLKLDPGFDWAKRYLGIYYMRQGDSQKAIDYYTKRVREDPGTGEFWVGLASAYESVGQRLTALRSLQEGSQMAPDYKELYGFGFRMAAVLGQREVARDFVMRWLSRHPEDEEFRAIYKDIDRILDEETGGGRGNEASESRGEE